MVHCLPTGACEGACTTAAYCSALTAAASVADGTVDALTAYSPLIDVGPVMIGPSVLL